MALNFPDSPALNETFTSGGTTWQYNGTAWNIVTASSSLVIPNAFGTVAVSGQDSVVAESDADTLTLVAGTNVTITTDSSTDTVTIASTSGGGGGGGDVTEAFTTIAVAGNSSIVADSATDTLTLVGSAGVTITTNADTDTITISGPGSTTNFSGLTDVQVASLTIDKVYLPAITMLDVTNVGASAYNFDQYTGNNPTIYAISGTTIAFNLNTMEGNHPFLIQDFSGTNYNTGLIHVSNSGTVSTATDAQGKTSGVLYWKVPSDQSGTFRYQCSLHIGMVGNITVKAFASL